MRRAQPEADCRAVAAVLAGVVIVIPDRVEVRIPTLVLEEETTMTDATIALAGMAELADKGPDARWCSSWPSA